MRLRLLIPALLVGALLAASAPAATRGVGAGLLLGEPTGLTVKLWVDQDEAWVLGLGGSYLRDPALQAQADYVLHIFEIGRAVGLPQMPAYTGLGVRVNGPEDGRLNAGLRLPAGLACFFDNNQVELFAELVPVLNLVPNLRADIDFGIGIRYYGW